MPPESIFDGLVRPLRELDGREQLGDELLAPLARDAVQLREDQQILARAQLEIARHRLRDHADRPAHGVRDPCTMSAPPTIAVPEVGEQSVVSMRMSVDLPAPFGPSSPKISPSLDGERDAVDSGEIAEALA